MRKFRPRVTSAITAATLAALTCVGGAALTTPAEAASSGAVINEVYGGGGNSGATLTNDFIELANAGTSAAALDGWSVQYISASPGATTTWQVTPLTGSLSGGGLYLIGEAAGTGGTTGLPPTQASGSINMSGTSGTVALVDNSTPLTCKTAADCAADSEIVDLVGYGTAVIHEGSAEKQLSIATYNVENLAPGNPDSKFQALAQGIVTNLASPDIIAVEEVQDNDGATDDGVVAADQTISKLTAAVVAAGGPHYDSREIDPVNDQDGGQPGGNIRVVFLYNPAVVTFVDAGAATVNRSTTGTQVTKKKGEPALTLSPGRIDPTNAVWNASRKPLVGQFEFNGKDVFVIANHFDAKLGDQSQDGRFQFPAQSSAVQRAGQALVEHNFINQILAIDKQADVVVVGDLNDYQFSPALSVLKTGTSDGSGKPTLTDLITTLPASQQYTYDFDGVSEVLDHILITKGIGKFTYQVVHVNAEFANQVSDHDPQVVDIKP